LATGAPPRTPLGELKRSPDPLAGGEGLVVPSARTTPPLGPAGFKLQPYGSVSFTPEKKSWLRPWHVCNCAGLLLTVQVRNLSVAYVDHTRLELIWKAPPLTGDVTKFGILRYSVSCATCGDNVTFIPARSKLNHTRSVGSLFHCPLLFH